MKNIRSYLIFFALLLLPLLLYPIVDASAWRSNGDVHALLEFASSLLAITAGIMVLLHFFTKGEWFFLIISIGFVQIGAEEFVHAIFSFSRLWSEAPPTLKLAISTTWLAGQLILVASFFIALVFGKKKIVSVNRGLYAIVSNSIGVICSASVALLIFNVPMLPRFVQLGSPTKQTVELFLGLLFFTAFLFYFRRHVRQQSRSPLLGSIVACLVVRVLVHVFVFDSREFFDAHWDAAHLLVFLSYFFPVFGVWGETVKMNRSSQAQVIVLEKEMAERRKAEEALTRSQVLLRSCLESQKDTILLSIDRDYRYLYFNKAHQDVMKAAYGTDVALGMNILECITSDGDRKAARENYERALMGESHSNVRIYGSVNLAYFESYFNPIRDDENVIIGATALARDITGRMRTEQKLLDKIAEMERFTYTVSHDLKSPLVTIQTFAGMIRQDVEDGDHARARDDLKIIEGAAAKMTNLLNDLLELSRIGRQMNVPARIDMNGLVKDVLEQLAGSVKRGQVDILVQPDLPAVFGDQKRITQVVLNLVENAIKYMGDQAAPRIEIGASREGTQSVFFVDDNGSGIAPLNHERIFDLFNKLDATSPGTGVGLALVKRIIELHGGRVWVESQGVGMGSCFRFALPSASGA